MKLFFSGNQEIRSYCSLGASARVFVRIMHEKPETAGAKMSVLCSIHDNRILHLNSIVCVHHVAVNGEAVNSNNPEQ